MLRYRKALKTINYNQSSPRVGRRKGGREMHGKSLRGKEATNAKSTGRLTHWNG